MRKGVIVLVAAVMLVFAAAHGKGPALKREYIELRIYHISDSVHLRGMMDFLRTALVPALKRQGIGRVGVFTMVGNDTAADKRIYLLIPFASVEQSEVVWRKLGKDKKYLEAGVAYHNAAHDSPPYLRYETVLLRAFELMPRVEQPALSGPVEERVYELRSYESATEKLYANKVEMFNAGGEIGLFKRLGFNAVFYGEVVYGSSMPNLMYMTSFENRASRDAHWKAFGSDAEWKELSARPEYRNNVSRIEIVFLVPASFSGL